MFFCAIRVFIYTLALVHTHTHEHRFHCSKNKCTENRMGSFVPANCGIKFKPIIYAQFTRLRNQTERKMHFNCFTIFENRNNATKNIDSLLLFLSRNAFYARNAFRCVKRCTSVHFHSMNDLHWLAQQRIWRNCYFCAVSLSRKNTNELFFSSSSNWLAVFFLLSYTYYYCVIRVLYLCAECILQRQQQRIAEACVSITQLVWCTHWQRKYWCRVRAQSQPHAYLWNLYNRIAQTFTQIECAHNRLSVAVCAQKYVA